MASEENFVSPNNRKRDEPPVSDPSYQISKPSDEGVWEDVTEAFQNAKSEMEIGELIHLESFNLHAAMSAIELMDPKMDIGFEKTKNAADVVLPTHLSDLQVINIMDELLACQMSWFDAHTLPQTVFSCVFTQRMYQIPRFELFSFIRVQLAVMDCILNLILEEKVADDEDFIASTYGFNLRPLRSDPPEEDYIILRKIMQKIEGRPVEDTDHAKSLADAISLRVHVQVVLYRIVQCLTGFSFEDYLVDAPQLLQKLKGLVSEWEACVHRREVDKELIHHIFDSSINRHLMTSSPPRTAPLFDVDSALKYFARLVREWTELVNLDMFTLPSDPAQGMGKSFRRYSLQVAMHSVSLFSSNLNPTIVTRSLLSRLMVPDYASCLFSHKNAEFKWLMATDMGLTPTTMTPAVMAMLIPARGGIIDIFKCFCRNRSRQRRQVIRMLRWWDHYAFVMTSKPDNEAESVTQAKHESHSSRDEREHQGNCSTSDSVHRREPKERGSAVDALFASKNSAQIVAYELSARLMIHHWLLGFECDLYQEYEYAAVFFYVGYVLTTMANATTSLAEKGKEGASLHSLRFALYTMDEARLWMCRAMHSALEAFSSDERSTYSCGRPNSRSESGSGMFGSEALWYEQRFGVVKELVNGPVYADFEAFLSFKKAHEEALLSGKQRADLTVLLIEDAANGFMVARRTLERAKKTAEQCSENKLSGEILQIARVAVENSLALSQLLRVLKSSRSDQKSDIKYDVNFKFVRHRHFPVINIQVS